MSEKRKRRRVGAVQENASPFEPLTPNAQTIRAMQQARRGMLQGFGRVEDLMTDLNAKV